MVPSSRLGVQQVIVACVIAGLVPAVVAPLSIVLTRIMVSGEFVPVPIIGLAAIAVLGVLIGIGMCLLLGTPSILILARFGVRSPSIFALIGAAFASVLFVRFGPAVNLATWDTGGQVLSPQSVLGIFALNGAACGFVAARVSHHNKSLKADAVNGAA